MKSQPKAEILTALVCDDARKEASGKEIVIGIYTGDILVQAYPASLSLCLWILASFKSKGATPLQLRLVGGDGSQLVHFEGTAEIDQPDTPATLPLPRFLFSVGKNSRLKFEWRIGAGEWQTVIEKQVRLHPAGAKASVV